MKLKTLKTTINWQKVTLSNQQSSKIKGGNADIDPELTTIIYDNL